ncbi:MAG: hypothetical protein ABL998_20960 [Planctomycetota bacterium]
MSPNMSKKRATTNKVELKPQPRRKKAAPRKPAQKTGAYFTEDGMLVIPKKLAKKLFPGGVPRVPIAADGVVVPVPPPKIPVPPRPNEGSALCFQLTLNRFSHPVEVSVPTARPRPNN